MKTIYSLLISSILLATLVAFPDQVNALSPANGAGVYTNLCGTGYDASGYNCPASCDTASGSCSGAAVAKFVCDGRQTECRFNESWSTYQTINGTTSCDKTVQIDVFTKNCRDGSGNWICNGLPAYDPDSDLKGYIVWYSGVCALPTVTPTPTGVPTPTPTTTPTPTSVPTPTVIVPTTTPPQGNVIQCPEGYVQTISGSNIICVQQVQDQSQSSSSTSTASTGSINISVPMAPQAIPVKTVAYQPTELPKTGLPLVAWSLSGLTPLGLRLKKFGSSGKDLQDSAAYIWQERQFLKD